MKIQIDTEKKVLRLESDVNLGEFMTKIKVLFPKGEWKDFKLETNVEVKWSNPIYIDRWHYPSYPWWPTWTPITYEYSSDTPVIATYEGDQSVVGVYNVEV